MFRRFRGVFLFVTINLILFSSDVSAAEGCLIDGTTNVYTIKETDGVINALLVTLFGGDPFYGAPVVLQSTTCINNSQIKYLPTSSRCNACSGGYSTFLGLVSGCSGSRLQGYISNTATVYCDLDEYTWVLGAAAGLFGVFVIRRRNKL